MEILTMTTTTLAPVDQAYIEEVVRKAIANMMNSVSSHDRYEMELRERVIRVEEGLKHQSELMQAGFALMEKRFEQVDKRFEQVDKRFEQVDKRFEQVDKRFEQVDKRFEQMQQEMLKGFEQQHREIIALHNEMKIQMRWGFGILLTAAGLVIAVIKML
jgi:chaperonin cofactor prefoldin